MITLKEIPSGRRTPGAYVEYNTKLAARGLAASSVRVLLIGQRLSTGSAAALTLVTSLNGQDDGSSAFGPGSQLGLAIGAAFKANPNATYHAIGLNDLSSGNVAASGQIVFSGTATRSGTLVMWVGNQRARVNITKGDAAAVVAAAVNTALGQMGELPVTSAVSTATLTLTARNKGTQGNFIRLRVDFGTITGVAAAITQPASGSGDPVLETALDLVAGESYDLIVTCLNDSTSLAALAAHLEEVSGPLSQKPGVGVFATTGTYGDATSLSATLNNARLTHAWSRANPSQPAELAAAYAAILASHADPALPYNGESLSGAGVPLIVDRPTGTEVENALKNGVTPLAVSLSEVLTVVRAISTYVLDENSAVDVSLLDITTIRSLDFYRAQVLARVRAKYKQGKNTSATRAAIRADILDVALQLEQPPFQVLHKVSEYKDGFVVEADPADPNRAIAQIPAPVVPGLHVLAGQIQLSLEG